MKSEFGKVAHNLGRADIFIQQAVQCEAQLVLLPEFMPSGYAATEELWKYAETITGPSVAWLMKTAKFHRIYLAFTFIETDGKDFYNTFVLVGTDGRLLGRVRKNPPCSKESYYFRPGSDSHIIETELGRIGVGICYENLLFSHMRFMHRANAAFMLLPAAARRPATSFSKENRRLKSSARSIFVSSLGIPVIVANIAVNAETELPENLAAYKAGFPSSSSIVDGNGQIKAEGGFGEGVVVGNVTLNGDAHRLAKPKRFRFLWAVPVPWHAFMWWLIQKMGQYSYIRNPRRKSYASLFFAETAQHDPLAIP